MNYTTKVFKTKIQKGFIFYFDLSFPYKSAETEEGPVLLHMQLHSFFVLGFCVKILLIK